VDVICGLTGYVRGTGGSGKRKRRRGSGKGREKEKWRPVLTNLSSNSSRSSLMASITIPCKHTHTHTERVHTTLLNSPLSLTLKSCFSATFMDKSVSASPFNKICSHRNKKTKHDMLKLMSMTWSPPTEYGPIAMSSHKQQSGANRWYILTALCTLQKVPR